MQSPRSSRARGLSSAPALPALGGGAEAASPLPASTFSSASADATAPASPRASFKARAPSQGRIASPAASAPAAAAGRQHEPCQRCGATRTPVWRPAVFGGPKELCNACGLKRDTLRAIHGTPDGKPVRAASATPASAARPPKTLPMATLPEAAPLFQPAPLPPLAPLDTDCSAELPAAAGAAAAAAGSPQRTPRRSRPLAGASTTPLTRRVAREVTPEPSPRPAEALEHATPPRLFKSPHARDADASPARTRSGMTPLRSPGAGFRTPLDRMRPMERGPISPATSNDARQLMFLSVSHSHRPSQLRVTTQPKARQAQHKASGSKSAGGSISERNRAAAMARWHYPGGAAATPSSAPAATCRKCDKALKATAASAGQQLCGGCDTGRKRKAGGSPANEAPGSPLTRAARRAAGGAPFGDCSAVNGEDLADADFNPQAETVVPAPAAAPARPAKKARRASVAKGGGNGSAGRRPGRPPKWPERGEPAARDAAAAMLPGDFTRVEQVLVQAPGRPPFHLARLAGAPHGQPALALRQVQVALVPHTDRSSAFYLAMIRAAEAVSGMVRSAERPEMALLVSGGALAKGACRASISTFPAVLKGLARLGVDDATLAALEVHDVRSPDLRTPLPAPAAPAALVAAAAATPPGSIGEAAAAAVPSSGAGPATAGMSSLGDAAEEMAAPSPPAAGRRSARSARGGGAGAAAVGAAAAAAAAPSPAPPAAAVTPAALPLTASAFVSVSHRRRSRKPGNSTPAAVLAPMFASPDSHYVSGGSVDTAVAVDPAWSLQLGAGQAPRLARSASRPRKFSPEPGFTSDDGSTGRGKRRRASNGGESRGDAGQALCEAGVHADWLPLLQRPPTAAMQAAARLALEQHLDAGQALPRKPHVTFEEPAPTDSGASDGGHIRGAPFAEHQLANGCDDATSKHGRVLSAY